MTDVCDIAALWADDLDDMLLLWDLTGDVGVLAAPSLDATAPLANPNADPGTTVWAAAGAGDRTARPDRLWAPALTSLPAGLQPCPVASASDTQQQEPPWCQRQLPGVLVESKPTDESGMTVSVEVEARPRRRRTRTRRHRKVTLRTRDANRAAARRHRELVKQRATATLQRLQELDAGHSILLRQVADTKAQIRSLCAAVASPVLAARH